MKKIIIIVAVILIIGFGIYGATRLKKGKYLKSIVKIPAAPVRKGKFIDAIEMSCKISQSKEIYIRTPGLMVFEKELTVKPALVKNEISVKKGQLLIEFDTSEIENVVREQELELNKLKFDLDKANKDIKIKENESNQKIIALQNLLAEKRAILEKYKTIDAPKEVENVKIDLKEAEHNYEDAKEELKQAEIMFKKELISKTKLEEARLNLKKAKGSIEIAKLKSELFNEYQHPSELVKLIFDVQETEFNLKKDIFTKEIELAKINAEIEKIKRSIDIKEEKINNMKKDLTILKKGILSSANGIIKYVLEEKRMQIAPHSWQHASPLGMPTYQKGGKVGQDRLIFFMPGGIDFSIKLELIEEDIVKVKVKDKTIIKLDAFPNVMLFGTVSSISDIAEYSWRERINKYTTIIKMDSDSVEKAGVELKPGYACKIEIVIKELRKDTIYVPVDAVFEKDGKYICYIEKKDKTFEEREIKIGVSTDKYVEVLTGLTGKETVYLEEPIIIE